MISFFRSFFSEGAGAGVWTYGRMIKFSHTVFAMPFALSAVVLAADSHAVTGWRVFWILVAMVGARSAAMGFNRIVDAGFDAENPRTRNREIPAGLLSVSSAALFVVLSAGTFFLASAALGRLCAVLSLPVLIILLGYSLTKRFTAWCHFYLGLAISLAPAGAWIGITGEWPSAVWWLSLALMTHIAGFDMLYACQDVDFDIGAGLHSMPSRLGVARALVLARWVHGVCLTAFVLTGISFGLGWIYYLAVLAIAGLLVLEHRMVSPEDLSKVPVAFFHVNSVISVVLFVGVCADALLL